MATFETKKHGTLTLRNYTVDQLTQLMFETSVEKALINLCQTGRVMKNGKELLRY